MEREVGASGVRLKIIWTVVRHGQRTYRTRIGVAWEGDDGALTARLDAIPLTGEMVVTDWVPSSHPEAGREPVGGAR